MEELIVKVDGKDYKVKIEETTHGTLKIHCQGDVYEIETKPSVKDIEIAQRDIFEEGNLIKAPLPGVIVEVKVKKGQSVNAGDTLIKLVAMKMENEITTPRDGRIAKINVKKKDTVNRGDVLIVME